MGTFYVRCKVENHIDRAKSVVVPKLLVDTGSDYTWIPATLLEKIGTRREKKDMPFVRANGQQIAASALPSFGWTSISRLMKSYSQRRAICRCWVRGHLKD